MSNIAYDPIKDSFSRIIGRSKFKRTLFYYLLDLIFLRSWHVRKTLSELGHPFDTVKEWFLLDAGCGFGQYDSYILRCFNRVVVTGIDLKRDYLDDCSTYFSEEIKSGRISFSEKNLYDINYHERFDIVICIDVLEHIEKDELVIKNIADSLKKGGYFLMHSPSGCYIDKENETFFVDEHFRQGYTKKDIEDKFTKAGMTMVNTQYTYGFAGHLAWLIGIKTPMILISKLKPLGFLILLFYFPLILPGFLLLNYIDTFSQVRKGRGILAVGKK